MNVSINYIFKRGFKYLLSALLGSGNIAVNKETKILPSWCLHCSGGKKQQTVKTIK